MCTWNKTSLLHLMADEDVENQLMFTSSSVTGRMHFISFSRYKPCGPFFVFAQVTIKLFNALQCIATRSQRNKTKQKSEKVKTTIQ